MDRVEKREFLRNARVDDGSEFGWLREICDGYNCFGAFFGVWMDLDVGLERMSVALSSRFTLGPRHEFLDR